MLLCAVVRVAPLQKAGIVDLIKTRNDDMTLAIGDGKSSLVLSSKIALVLSSKSHVNNL